MQKSTVILGITCVVLTAALGASLSVLVYMNHQTDYAAPRAGGQSGIGWPVDKPARTQQTVSTSAILWDQDARIILYENNSFARRSIASLTKLMTGMVALDIGIDWDKTMTIRPEENVIGGNITAAADELLTMRDLWHASLMGSANNATLALVRGLNVPEQEFVRAMNRKAVTLGLEQTEFKDVTGLAPGNQSTAYEIARLAEVAFTVYPDIAAATSRDKYEHVFGGSGRSHTIVNTNNLMVDYGYKLSGSKTGYLDEAGFNLAVRGVDKKANRIAVALGAPSEWDSMNDIKTLLEMQ